MLAGRAWHFELGLIAKQRHAGETADEDAGGLPL
jgi:hypothetical protein